GVPQHFFDVVIGVFHVEAGGERLRLAAIVVADRGHFGARKPAQHREMRHLRDAARAQHADANGIVHFGAGGGAGAAGCRPAFRRYMTPVRRLAVLRPVERTPRPSSVNRHAFERLNSWPSVPLSPAVMMSSASSTNVPSIAAPLPLRT